MASTGSSGTSGTSGAGPSGGSGSTTSRLFRNEGLVSEADLRVDVAKWIARIVVQDSHVDLDAASVHARGNLRISRLSRAREVVGNYVSIVEKEMTNMIDIHVEERVLGGVEYIMQKDCDVIMGGAYLNTIAGPYARVCAWADYLIWGGWLEVDTIRLDIAGLMIRAYMFYAHATLARVAAATKYVDDFMIRNETFGVLVDNQGSAIHLGGPGASMEMSM